MIIDIPKASDYKITLKIIEKSLDKKQTKLDSISDYNRKSLLEYKESDYSCSFNEISRYIRCNVAQVLSGINRDLVTDRYYRALTNTMKNKYSCRVEIFILKTGINFSIYDLTAGLPKKSFVYYKINNSIHLGYTPMERAGYKELTKLELSDLNEWGYSGDKQPTNMMMLSDYSYSDLEELIYEDIEGIGGSSEYRWFI